MQFKDVLYENFKMKVTDDSEADDGLLYVEFKYKGKTIKGAMSYDDKTSYNFDFNDKKFIDTIMANEKEWDKFHEEMWKHFNKYKIG